MWRQRGVLLGAGVDARGVDGGAGRLCLVQTEGEGDASRGALEDAIVTDACSAGER